MAIETAADAPVGTKVNVTAAEYAFGTSFLAGEGEVVEDRDFVSRSKGNVKVRFDNVTGVFGPSSYHLITVI